MQIDIKQPVLDKNDALAAELQKTVPDARRIGTVSDFAGAARVILR